MAMNHPNAWILPFLPWEGEDQGGVKRSRLPAQKKPFLPLLKGEIKRGFRPSQAPLL
jgi:hypothetical protein